MIMADLFVSVLRPGNLCTSNDNNEPDYINIFNFFDLHGFRLIILQPPKQKKNIIIFAIIVAGISSEGNMAPIWNINIISFYIWYRQCHQSTNVRLPCLLLFLLFSARQMNSELENIGYVRNIIDISGMSFHVLFLQRILNGA